MSTDLKKAVLYNTIAKYGTMLIQLGLTMILSRLIVPESYGIVAIVTVLIGFLNLFSDLGLGIKIIQYPNMSKCDIDYLYSFSWVVGFILALIITALSYPISIIYNNDIYKIICPIISVVPFLNSINVIPNAILTRDKRFDLIAARTILSSIVSGIIAVIIALNGGNIYALLCLSILSSLFLP